MGKPNCKHKELIFLGYQQVPESVKLALYNCTTCHTTITLKEKGGGNRVNKPPVKIKL